MLLKKIIPSCDSISSWQVPLLGPFPQPLHSWAQLCRRCLPGQFLPSLLSHAPELLPITAPRDSLWNEGKNLRDGLAILKCHFCKGTQSRTALKNAQHPAWDQLLKAEMSNSAHRENFEGSGIFPKIIQVFFLGKFWQMRPNFVGKYFDAVQQFLGFFRTNYSSSCTFTELINNLGSSPIKDTEEKKREKWRMWLQRAQLHSQCVPGHAELQWNAEGLPNGIKAQSHGNV